MGLFLTQLLSLNEKIWMEMCTEGQCIKGYMQRKATEKGLEQSLPSES